MTTKEQIFNQPLEKTPLSVGAYIFYKKNGFKTVGDIIEGDQIETLYRKVVKTTGNIEEIGYCQKYYNELLDYLRYMKIELEEKKISIQIQDNNEQIKKIASKLIYFCKEIRNPRNEILEQLASNIINLKTKTIIELNEQETLILRMMCGLYDNNIEQSSKKVSEKLNIPEKEINKLFYKSLDEIGKYVDNKIIKEKELKKNYLK